MSDEIMEFVLERMKAQREHRRPRCYGISSDALTLYALGKGPRPQTPGRPDREGGATWTGSEVGRDYPHDESDLGACELTYAMAPEVVKVAMAPVLEEFRAWVREGKNRYGEKARDIRHGEGITSITFKTSQGEVHV
jgi:hypothetical protein